MRIKVNKLPEGDYEVIASEPVEGGQYAYCRHVVPAGSDNQDFAAAGAACGIALAKMLPSKYLGASSVH